MLKDMEPVATVAVRDLAVARKFYEGALGLTVEAENSEVLTFKDINVEELPKSDLEVPEES